MTLNDLDALLAAATDDPAVHELRPDALASATAAGDDVERRLSASGSGVEIARRVITAPGA